MSATLVILSPAFPANEKESTWLPAQQLLVKEIRKQSPELNIILISFLYPESRAEYNWNGVKVISLGGLKYRRLKRLLLWRRALKILKQLKKENEVVGILSFWCGECALIGNWFARRNKLKHFIWVCGQDARRSNKLVKWIRPKPTQLVAISDFLVDEFANSHGIRPARVIPIAIDPKMFPPLPEKRDIDIIGAGSYSYQKNFAQFVSIVGELKKRFPSITAVQCGSGEDKENIVNLVERFGLKDNLELMGEIPHPEVLSIMQRSKILLHPSSYEGFGMVYLEALYAGAQVISFTKPMNMPIKNWTIVNTKEEMINKAAEFLQLSHLVHERVLVFSIEETARKIMRLFH